MSGNSCAKGVQGLKDANGSLLPQISHAFRAQFGRSPEYTHFAPGRVNLIGEHLDYNGGKVLPIAIEQGTYVAARANGSSELRVYSAAFDECVSISVGTVGDELAGTALWAKYIEGVLTELSRIGSSGSGLDICVIGDLPRNSGLSSSASFTLAIINLLNSVWAGDLPLEDQALLAQRVENHHIGLQCGIMDQLSIAVAQPGHCLAIDCAELSTELVPFELDAYELVITDSKVPRELASSAYNERRAQCERALQVLNSVGNFKWLCEPTLEQLAKAFESEEDSVSMRRARHAISEQARVEQAITALTSGDAKQLGTLMTESHYSLRDDFDVCCEQLNYLVDTAISAPGVLGSRMTGAGFGGCTLSLVETDAIDAFIARSTEAYQSKFDLAAKCLRSRPSAGVRRLTD